MPTTRRNFLSLGTGATAIATLVKWLGWTEMEIATGKTLSEWGAVDTRAVNILDQNLPPERRRDLILQDLSILDPTTYPPRDLVRVTRTSPRYIWP